MHKPTESRLLPGHSSLLCGTAQALAVRPVWVVGNGVAYALAAVTLAGVLLTQVARIHLGYFWSNAITHKEGHRVIDTGPYRDLCAIQFIRTHLGNPGDGSRVGTITAMLARRAYLAGPVAKGPHGVTLSSALELGVMLMGPTAAASQCWFHSCLTTNGVPQRLSGGARFSARGGGCPETAESGTRCRGITMRWRSVSGVAVRHLIDLGSDQSGTPYRPQERFQRIA